MGFLEGKKILITGVVSNRSIAYGVARACRREGAELAFTYANDRFAERVAGFAHDFGSDICLQMDVGDDAQIAACFDELAKRWDGLDGLVHSIGFAPRDCIAGDFLEGITREGFRTAMDISAYSYPALAKAALPMMRGRKAAMVALTYIGSDRTVPNYNTMGLCKAALESATRYIAGSVGPLGIRANAVSSGPIRTLAASGIQGFGKILSYMEESAPLRRTVTTEEVGNTVAFLLSDLASGITGNVAFVDAGFHAVGVSPSLTA